MKKLFFLLIILALTSCKKDDEIIEYGALHWQVTMLLPDYGLGDESLFDGSFEGVMNFMDEVGVSSVDIVLNLPYGTGDSDSNLKQWISSATSTNVNHRLLFCPMPSEEQCKMLASAKLSEGDEVLIVCGNGEIASKLQTMSGIADNNCFHIYILDSKSAGEEAGKALAEVYRSSYMTDARKCAAILTTNEGLSQNNDLVEGLKAGVKSVTGEEPFVRITVENTDSTFQITSKLSKEYACILPATYYSNYGTYCALLEGTPFHTFKLDGVVPPTATLENININRNIKDLACTLLSQWRKGQTLEHIKTTTILCEK